MKVTVIRPFLLRGERQEVGSVVDMPDELAREFVALNKATPATATPPPVGPMTTTTAAAVVAGAKPATKTTAAQHKPAAAAQADAPKKD